MCQASSPRVSASTSVGSLPAATSATRHTLEHLAQIGAQRDPHLLEGLGGAAVGDLLGALAAHPHERALDGADHLREGHLRRRDGPASSRPRARAGCARCPAERSCVRMFSRKDSGIPCALAMSFWGSLYLEFVRGLDCHADPSPDLTRDLLALAPFFARVATRSACSSLGPCARNSSL